MVYGQKMGKHLYHSIVLAKIDDVTVMLSLIVLSWTFLRTDLGNILLHAKSCQD